jgi:hypothetical protein
MTLPAIRFALVACACFTSVALVQALPPINPPPLPTPSPTPSPTLVIHPNLPTPTPTLNPPIANPDGSIPVVIAYGDGLETRAQITRGLMEPVGIPFDKPATVTLFLGSAIPGTPVHAGLYDGGAITAVTPPAVDGGGNSVQVPPATAPILVLADQTVQFNFRSGGPLGLYRVLLTIGAKQYLLQFYAVRPRSSSSLPPLPIKTPNPPPLQGTTPHP